MERRAEGIQVDSMTGLIRASVQQLTTCSATIGPLGHVVIGDDMTAQWRDY